jgi:cell division protein FtsB
MALQRTAKVMVVRAGALAILVAAVQFAFNSDTRERSEYLQGEVQRMRTQNRDILAENERLRLQLDGINSDDRYLEQLARQEFGMIKDGEVLYKFTARQ